MARKIWGSTVDARGYTVASGRDRISAWEAGKAIPEPHNLEAVAKALGVLVSDLAPDLVGESSGRTKPAVQLTVLPADGSTEQKVLLVVNMVVPLALAVRVMGLLGE